MRSQLAWNTGGACQAVRAACLPAAAASLHARCQPALELWVNADSPLLHHAYLASAAGNVWLQAGEERRDRVDVGLCVKNGAKGLYVPDFARPMMEGGDAKGARRGRGCLGRGLGLLGSCRVGLGGLVDGARGKVVQLPALPAMGAA